MMTDHELKRYAYEKAIEAYWKHVDRYHTWMNYYSLFNGALFVGFCTLLTATTEITSMSEDSILHTSSIELSNNCSFLIVIVCLIGFLASIFWIKSVLGHEKWENSWLNIVEFYEDIGVYKLIISDINEMNMTKKNDHLLEEDEYFMAYSTHYITKEFVICIILGWLGCLLYSIYLISSLFEISFLPSLWETVGLLLISIIVIFYVIIPTIEIYHPRSFLLLNNEYSNVKGKYWKNKM